MGKRNRCMQVLKHEATVQQAHFCEGGASVLTTASGITRLWQIHTGECMLTFSGSCAHLFELNHALPRPSGSQYCSTEADKREKREKRERKDKMHMAHKEKKHRETKCEENAEKLLDEAQCEEEAKEKHDQQHETREKKEKKDKNEREDDG